MQKELRITYYDNIPANPQRKSILARLGHRKTTIVNEKDSAYIDAAIKTGLSLCELKGASCRIKIDRISEDRVELENGMVFISHSLAKLLLKSREVLLMASTAGSDITEKIREEIEKGEVALGVIMDGVASEKADTGLDYISELVYKSVRREGKRLTKMRFSPGYGDLHLENQLKIFNILNLKYIGLSITERYMLIPEKSVIAIAGIEEIDKNG